MPRGLTTTNANASKETALYVALYLDMDFPGGKLAYTTGPRDVTFNGVTYKADGTLGALDAVEESGDISNSRSVTFVMAGMNPTLGAALLANNFTLRTANVYLGFSDSSWNNSDTPATVSLFRMSACDREITEGEDKWALSCESYLIDMGRINGLRQVDGDQQSRFPGDLFFSLKPTLAYRILYWGPNPYAVSRGTGGGFILSGTPGAPTPFNPKRLF